MMTTVISPPKEPKEVPKSSLQKPAKTPDLNNRRSRRMSIAKFNNVLGLKLGMSGNNVGLLGQGRRNTVMNLDHNMLKQVKPPMSAERKSIVGDRKESSMRHSSELSGS